MNLYPSPISAAPVQTGGGNLNLRARPDTASSVVAVIPDGAKVEIYGQYEGWYVVHYGSYVGYAAAAYIDT